MVVPSGRPVELHAGLDVLGEHAAFLEEHQVGVVVAESVLGLQMQRGLEAFGLADDRFLDLGQQVVATDEELHRLGQFVDQLTVRIFEPPSQTDDAGGRDLHERMIAQ